MSCLPAYHTLVTYCCVRDSLYTEQGASRGIGYAYADQGNQSPEPTDGMAAKEADDASWSLTFIKRLDSTQLLPSPELQDASYVTGKCKRTVQPAHRSAQAAK